MIMAFANGLELIEPSTINVTGTSASKSGNGSVIFTTVTALSLNDVFSSTYDNYIVVVRATHTGTSIPVVMRFRTTTDNSDANSYTYQGLQAAATSVSGSRTSGNSATIFNSYAASRVAATLYVWGPNLPQPTMFRSITMEDISSASICDFTGSHNAYSAFTGFSIIAGIGISGRIAVYGMRK